MKPKGIWIVIILILGIGIVSTRYTRKLVSVPYTELQPAITAETSLTTTAAAAGAVTTEDNDTQPATAARTLPEASAETAEKSSLETQLSAVKSRLMELDLQIERNHAGEQDTTTNGLKAAAESEKKLWETELERILNQLGEKLDQSDRDELFLQEKEWIRERESKAVSASGKQKGSALEELEYNISLRDETRARAYYLEEQYHDILMEAE